MTANSHFVCPPIAPAEATSPEAVVAWADSLGLERPVSAEAMKHLRNNPTIEIYWSRFSIPLYTHPTTKPEATAVSVDAIRAALEPVFSFLDELAANAEPSQRHALNPILIGGSARLYAEGARTAIATLIAGGR